MDDTLPDNANHKRLAFLARRLADPAFGPGARAALRRADPTTVMRQAAFHRLIVEAQIDESQIAGDGWLRWATVLHAMAIGIRPGLHPPGRPAGEALARAGYAESRFMRLLAAHDELLRDQIVLLARFMHARDEPLEWRDLGELVLADTICPRTAERVRLRLARSYYKSVDAAARLSS
jgi:CRISPR system Cascade subunit CasB